MEFTNPGDWHIEGKMHRKKAANQFFRKTLELYPDSPWETDKVIICGGQVIIEWTVRTTFSEPFYGGLSRTVPVVLHGASIVRTANGKITEWTDDYGAGVLMYPFVDSSV